MASAGSGLRSLVPEYLQRWFFSLYMHPPPPNKNPPFGAQERQSRFLVLATKTRTEAGDSPPPPLPSPAVRTHLMAGPVQAPPVCFLPPGSTHCGLVSCSPLGPSLKTESPTRPFTIYYPSVAFPLINTNTPASYLDCLHVQPHTPSLPSHPQVPAVPAQLLPQYTKLSPTAEPLYFQSC